MCFMRAWCVGSELVFVCVLDVCLCLMGVCESAFECKGTVPVLVPVASVADPHRKNADADPGKNLNADADPDSCSY